MALKVSVILGRLITIVNTNTHDELIESLAELRRALPSIRLGQLIANMATVARGAVPGAVWEVEAEELSVAIRWQLEQLASRVTPENSQPDTPASGGRGGSLAGVY